MGLFNLGVNEVYPYTTWQLYFPRNTIFKFYCLRKTSVPISRKTSAKEHLWVAWVAPQESMRACRWFDISDLGCTCSLKQAWPWNWSYSTTGSWGQSVPSFLSLCSFLNFISSKYSWFTVLWQSLLYRKVTQLYRHSFISVFFFIWFIPGYWV